MARLRTVDLSRARPETRAVLATLCLAAVWPARYPDGWVSLDDFSDIGLGLGGERSREGLKASIRRSLTQYRKIVGQLPVGRRREPESQTSTPSRETQLRLVPPVSQPLVVWFFGPGLGAMFPDKRHEFLQAAPHPTASIETALGSLEGLLPQLWQSWEDMEDATDALQRLHGTASASGGDVSTAVAYLRMLLRVGPDASPAAAGPILSELVAKPRALDSLDNVLVAARIAIEQSYWLSLQEIAWNSHAKGFPQALEQCTTLLSQPLTVEVGLLPADRARLHSVRSLIALAQAFRADPSERTDPLQEAEAHLHLAFQHAYAAGDVYGLIDVTLLMAEHLHLSHIDPDRLPSENTIDRVERGFLHAWGMMRKVRATGPTCLQLARSAETNALRGVLRVERKDMAAAQDLVDRSAYELRCLERSAHAAWHMRLREHTERRVGALWSRAGVVPDHGQYFPRGFYRADSPEDGESASVTIVETDISRVLEKRHEESGDVPKRRRKRISSTSAERQGDVESRKR